MNASEQEARYDREWENRLAIRLRDGDEQSFAELLNHFQKKVFRYAYQFVRNREDAMEITQETFLRIYRKCDQWQEQTSLSGWIYRITQNLCIDFYRKHNHRQQLTGSTDDGPELASTEPPWSSAPDRSEDFQQVIDLAEQVLTPQQKTVFFLKHLNGKKLQEIAAQLGISIGTVKTLHHRGIQKLRQRFSQFQFRGGQ